MYNLNELHRIFTSLFTSFIIKSLSIFDNTLSINSSSNSSNEVRLFVAAKEVDTIDSYAANQNIDKFDLVIDWGWFYFFTKPLFFIIDYLFKYSGNFGIAIVIITIGIDFEPIIISWSIVFGR